MFKNHNFSDELKEEILSVSEVIKLKKGEQIVTQGEIRLKVAIVISGRLRVYRSDFVNDREIALYYVEPDQICMIGIIAAMCNDSRRIACSKADSDSELLIIPSRYIREWTKKYPEWNNYILNTFLNHYTDLSETINELSFENLECRILKLLTQEEKLLGLDKVYITHQEIADKLGTSRVVVSRILKKLEFQNMIILYRGYIELHSKMIALI